MDDYDDELDSWDEAPPAPSLTRAQWDELDWQYRATPDPDAGSSETGEHWRLIALLNRLGHYPASRGAAVHLAQTLLDAGFIEED
jgi:hypothetical protein